MKQTFDRSTSKTARTPMQGFFGRLRLCLRGRRYEANPGDPGHVRGWVV